MGGVRIDDAESGRFASVADVFAEGGGVADALVPEALREGNGVAIEAEDDACEAICLDATQAALDSGEQAGGGMRRIEFSIDNLVSNSGPADLAAEDDGEPVPGEEAECIGGDEGRAIGQSGVADAERSIVAMFRIRHGESGIAGVVSGVRAMRTADKELLV